MMKVDQMKRVIPIVREIQFTNTNEDQAYMNIPIGIITAAKHTRYKRASGPLFGKCRLEIRKKIVTFILLIILCLKKKRNWYNDS